MRITDKLEKEIYSIISDEERRFKLVESIRLIEFNT
jgi:hypothetical protein